MTKNYSPSGSGETIEHVAYPHFPGRLYDCLACEAECFCTPGETECIYEGEHKTFDPEHTHEVDHETGEGPDANGNLKMTEVCSCGQVIRTYNDSVL